MTAARLGAPDSDVDAMAEVVAGEAAAWALGVRVEGRDVRGAMVSLCAQGEQRLSSRAAPDRAAYPLG